MLQRPHSRPRPGGPVARRSGRSARGVLGEELALIDGWFRSRLAALLDRLLGLAVPTAATILEFHNLKRRMTEIGEIDQAVKAAGAGTPDSGSVRPGDHRAMPF